MKSKTKDTKSGYKFHSRIRNPYYEEGLIRGLSLHLNAKTPLTITIKRNPKHLITLLYQETDPLTGLTKTKKYQTDEITRSMNNKRGRIEKFTEKFRNAYRAKRISVIMHTFSHADQSMLTFRRMLDKVKSQYKKISRKLLGFIWVFEIEPESLHLHYHLILAVERIQINQIPEELKFNSIWGSETDFKFVTGNISRWMVRYFCKPSLTALRVRHFGYDRNPFISAGATVSLD